MRYDLEANEQTSVKIRSARYISAHAVRSSASSVRDCKNHQGNVRFVDSVSENLKKKPKWQVFAVFMIPNVSGCLGLCYRTSLNEEMDGKLAGLGLELGMTLAL